ncbi:MAG: hypothetical protein A2138_03090 [Deltaproteobacteria bacterium RBG_16_71_12]|nr:MAG: hypothetical protein A2138_03090 [Deltaproteobacteria bacterium RBG_16_71_12]
MPRALESLTCPRCRSTALRAEGPAFGCWRCGGVFLRGAVADSLRLALDPRAHAAAERYVGSPFARVDLARAAACPVCRATMKRFPAGPVDVDTCAVHGTWYDPRELCAVRDALLANGVRAEAPVPVALPPVAAPPRPLPPTPPASLELADVPRAPSRVARDERLAFEFRSEQLRERAERDRAAAAQEPTIDVLGAVLGMVGITMPPMTPSKYLRRNSRHGHRRTSIGGAIVRAILN